MAARCYANRKVNGWMSDEAVETAETRRLGLRVASIGRDDALALCWAGHALVWVCCDYDTGAALIDQALSVNQNLAVALQHRAWLSVILGEHDAALAQLEPGAELLSPMDADIHRTEVISGWAHLFDGRFDEALKWTGLALVRAACPSCSRCASRQWPMLSQ